MQGLEDVYRYSINQIESNLNKEKIEEIIHILLRGNKNKIENFYEENSKTISFRFQASRYLTFWEISNLYLINQKCPDQIKLQILIAIFESLQFYLQSIVTIPKQMQNHIFFEVIQPKLGFLQFEMILIFSGQFEIQQNDNQHHLNFFIQLIGGYIIKICNLNIENNNIYSILQMLKSQVKYPQLQFYPKDNSHLLHLFKNSVTFQQMNITFGESKYLQDLLLMQIALESLSGHKFDHTQFENLYNFCSQRRILTIYQDFSTLQDMRSKEQFQKSLLLSGLLNYYDYLNGIQNNSIYQQLLKTAQQYDSNITEYYKNKQEQLTMDIHFPNTFTNFNSISSQEKLSLDNKLNEILSHYQLYCESIDKQLKEQLLKFYKQIPDQKYDYKFEGYQKLDIKLSQTPINVINQDGIEIAREIANENCKQFNLIQLKKKNEKIIQQLDIGN